MFDEQEAEKTAGEANGNTAQAEKKPNPREVFQAWLNRNCTVIPFPAVAELEKMLDAEFGKLSLAPVK